ncbi:hypothetical protein KW790_00860 [Candidatus Parcubacteria bacterium]|nr:hypothetical protein [Candidatus Parcubacteria bacterium]
MAKNIEDITPPERRSIRDIPIPESRRKNINILNGPRDIAPPQRMDLPPRESVRVNEGPRSTAIPEYRSDQAYGSSVPTSRETEYVEPRESRKKSRRGVWISLGVIAIFIALGVIFTLLSGATLTYVPKTSVLTLSNDSFSASKTQGNLLFSIVKLSSQKNTTAPASGEEQVSQKASGILVVYNDFSADPQKLITNTRFETTDGKIYRIQSDITVPGKKQTPNGSEPGSLEVTVVADQPGDTYNISPTDFTIPGLKGDPRFTAMYGRSKTPITGGFVGTIKKASAADVQRAKTTLEAQIKNDLSTQAKAQVPEDYVLIPSLAKMSFEVVPTQAGSSSQALITEKGDLYGVAFKKTDLDRSLTEKKLGSQAGQTVVIPDYTSLTFTLASSSQANLQTTENISFQVSGSAKVEWKTDESALASDLAGKPKTDFVTILKNYPSVVTGSASIKPFWRNTFPSDPTKIKIVETNATE